MLWTDLLSCVLLGNCLCLGHPELFFFFFRSTPRKLLIFTYFVAFVHNSMGQLGLSDDSSPDLSLLNSCTPEILPYNLSFCFHWPAHISSPFSIHVHTPPKPAVCLHKLVFLFISLKPTFPYLQLCTFWKLCPRTSRTSGNSLTFFVFLFASDLACKSYTLAAEENAYSKSGIIFRFQKYFTSSQLLTLYEDAFHPCYEYCGYS